MKRFKPRLRLLHTALTVALVTAGCGNPDPTIDSSNSVEPTRSETSGTDAEPPRTTLSAELERTEAPPDLEDDEEGDGPPTTEPSEGIDGSSGAPDPDQGDSDDSSQRPGPPVSDSSDSPRALITLEAPIQSVLYVGDSLYFDPGKVDDQIPLEYTNRLVDFISEHLADRYEAFSTTTFENASLPGVSVDRQPDTPDKTVRDVLDEKAFGPVADERPELVVYTVSRIDINRSDLPLEQLIVAVVEQISRDVADLTEAGIRVVIVPGIPVHDDLYRASAGNPANKPLNGRVDTLNAAIVAAGLPMLPVSFEALDVDGISGPDATFYRDFTIPEFAVWGITTDGVHLAESGQRAVASDIADGFGSIVFLDGPTSPSSVP